MSHMDGHGHEEWEDEYMRGYKDGFAEARREARQKLQQLISKANDGSDVVEGMRDHLASE